MAQRCRQTAPDPVDTPTEWVDILTGKVDFLTKKVDFLGKSLKTVLKPLAKQKAPDFEWQTKGIFNSKAMLSTHLLPVRTWWHPKCLRKHPGKIFGVVKTHFVGNFRNGLIGRAQQGLGFLQA